MAITTQDTDALETTIAQATLSLKSDLSKLQGELESFLHLPGCDSKQPTPTIADPVAEVIANLQDCKKIVQDIWRLSIDRIARRIVT